MSIFSKTKAVLWPKDGKVEIYLDKKDLNVFTLDLNLWEPKSDSDLVPLKEFVSQNRIGDISVLIPDDVVVTKSFIYDTKITSIEKKEVASLAQSMVNFNIDPEYIDFTLMEKGEQTIIQSRIADKERYQTLNSNISKSGLTISNYQPVSAAVSQVASSFNKEEYFFLYPVAKNESLLFLARGASVFLTTILKGTSLDIQKIINYSNLYFDNPVNKLYLAESVGYEISSTTKMEKTDFSESQIAQSLGKADNLPLPVLGLLADSSTPAIQPDIIPVTTLNSTSSSSSSQSMQNQKNLLPIIAVFILTAAIASVIFWFVANRGSEDVALDNPNGDVTEVSPTPELLPTEIPTPTIAINKAMKIQVLNATSINGQAATLKEKLTALGFTSVAVGNSREKVTGNEIRLKTTLAGTQAFFEQNLNSSFPATYTADLEDTSAYDAVFVIGTDLSAGGMTPPSSLSPETTDVTPTGTGTRVTPTTSARTTVTPTTVTPTLGE